METVVDPEEWKSWELTAVFLSLVCWSSLDPGETYRLSRSATCAKGTRSSMHGDESEASNPCRGGLVLSMWGLIRAA